MTYKPPLTEAQVEQIFAMLDTNKNGQIDYYEFQCIYSSQFLFQDEKALLNEFTRMDTNRDGLIDFKEIKEHLSRYDDELSDEDIIDMIASIDGNKDGKVV